jgi:hypothetical protein|mmetsp:Transcript_14713/g.26533  ORF Transcript_14713/g.26533 Transcript_14713/m.26533 type:complete len:458 (+) Transcript_14713:87-1460(+)|eukprot:CAMPEP_0174300296 /NCGR_PEP_ID=MMETSP0809-20121228/58359_1 /TAXON_ID=73025 ORGANISM="Eutreptiella gymnastica-like, Strain CCMP1594" /NCGR_SAMPLE_ID=MMETSP0809 /ASSEMBLY_ACC=CAM_ASM_000658 /LENGTH=457 /DNA_ID=CAMNT_0015405853 /DNA_START=88 /DNA_END=1461 /DNA_ORIENTATION=+
MGGGGSKVMHDSEWLRKRAVVMTMTLVDKSVTQSIYEQGLYCGEGGEQFLKKDRVELEVYLQDSSDFIDCYMKAWTLKRPEMQPFDMRPYVAHQIARLNWISDASQSALGDRFLLGLRDRNTPTIELMPINPKRKPLQMQLRINVLGDRAINRLMVRSESAKNKLATKIGTAEARLEVWSEKKPAMEYFDGKMEYLFSKRDIVDHSLPPDLKDFTIEDLPKQIGIYYKKLYSSELWSQYESQVASVAVPKLAKSPRPQMADAAIEPAAPPTEAPALPKGDAAEAAPPAGSALDIIANWPVDPDPYDYSKPLAVQPNPLDPNDPYSTSYVRRYSTGPMEPYPTLPPYPPPYQDPYMSGSGEYATPPPADYSGQAPPYMPPGYMGPPPGAEGAYGGYGPPPEASYGAASYGGPPLYSQPPMYPPSTNPYDPPLAGNPYDPPPMPPAPQPYNPPGYAGYP